MNDLTLVKSANFGNVKCDFWMDSNGDIWLTRKQIGQALRYADPQKAIDNLHAKHADRLNKFSVTLKVRGTDGKFYDTTLYNAKGIMEICRWSQQPKADSFMDWVWEVIDSIRKHGGYLTPQKVEEILLNPDTIIRLATDLKKEREQRKQLEHKVEQDKPKVLFADAVETAKTSILVGELAKLLRQNGVKIGQNRLFEWLRQNGYLIARAGHDHNMPTQYSMEHGLMEIKERTINNPDGSTYITRTPKITGKGQQYFINKFLGDERNDIKRNQSYSA